MSELENVRSKKSMSGRGIDPQVLCFYQRSTISRNYLKDIKHKLAKDIGLLKQLKLSEVSDSILKYRSTLPYDSQMKEDLGLFEQMLTDLNNVLTLAVDSIFKECIEPLTNFIDYDYNDVQSLKKQLDELTKSYPSKKKEDSETKIQDLQKVLSDKLDELKLKQESKVYDSLIKFLINLNTITNFKSKAADEMIDNMATRRNKKLVGITKEGYLQVRKKFGWVNKYFILKEGKLIYYDNSHSFQVYDLAMCSIPQSSVIKMSDSTPDLKRSLDKTSDKETMQARQEKLDCRFELIVASPKRKTFNFQAESKEERDDWKLKMSLEIQKALSTDVVLTNNDSIEK